MEAIEDSTPRQVGSYRRFNLVCWRARFYGVPFGTPIDWVSADVDNSPDVVTGATEAELRSRIDAQIVRIEQQAFDTPMQLESWAGFNIVRFQGEYFGVPHGQAGILWDSGIKQMAGVLCATTPERVRELIAAAKEGGQHAFIFDAHDPTQRWLDGFIHTDQPLTTLGLPEIIEIEPIHTCNMRCIMCHVSYERLTKEGLDVDRLLRALEGVRGRWAMLASSYEPAAHPQFADLVQGLDALDMNIDMTTNGSLFTPKLLDRIAGTNIRFVTVSFDGIRKSTFESIRVGADFDRTVERIRALRHALSREQTFFNLNQTLMRRNLDEVEESVEFWDRAGFDHMGLILMRMRNDNAMLRAENLEPIMDRVESTLDAAARMVIENQMRITLSSPVYVNSRLRTEFPEAFRGSMVVSSHRQRRIPVNPRDYYQNGYYPGAPVSCRSPFKFAKINFNGDVLLCHKFVVGNIYRSSFPDIWFGKEAARVRAGVTMPGNEKTCHTCHHYRFCVKAGEIDTREAENFRALSNSGRMKVTDQKVDDGTPILVGTVGLHSVFQWDGVYHAVPFERYQAEAGDCRPLMLDGAISGPGSVTSDNYEKVTRGLLVYAIRDSAVKLVLHTAKRVIRRLRKVVA